MKLNHFIEEKNLLAIQKSHIPKKIKFNLKKNTYLLPSFKKLDFNILLKGKKKDINKKLNTLITTKIFKLNSLSPLYPLSRKKILKFIDKKQKQIRTRMIVLKRPKIKIFKKRRRNKSRRFYYGFKWKKQKYKYRKIKIKRSKSKKRFKSKLKFHDQYLSIKIPSKNTFISLYQIEKNKTLTINKKRIEKLQLLRFQKKYKLYKFYKKMMKPKVYNITLNTKLILSKSLGVLGYKGRHKTSPISKESLGHLAGRTAVKNNFSYVDIILKKKIGRVYKPLLKGISQYPFLIRRIHAKMPHAHGFIRAKKKKRK